MQQKKCRQHSSEKWLLAIPAQLTSMHVASECFCSAFCWGFFFRDLCILCIFWAKFVVGQILKKKRIECLKEKNLYNHFKLDIHYTFFLFLLSETPARRTVSSTIFCTLSLTLMHVALFIITISLHASSCYIFIPLYIHFRSITVTPVF